MSDRQRRAKAANKKPNRAQRKAQEVRLAETNAPPAVDAPVAVEEAPVARPVAAAPDRPGRRVSRPKTAPATYTISRETEYAYIHSDLRRLILTAGAMLILMFVLLFLLD